MERKDFPDTDGGKVGALIERQFEQFRFLNSERKTAYISILFALFEERQAHQIEIFHDDLLNKTSIGIERLAGVEYPDLEFRQDIDQLVLWGNVVRKLEGRRVRSLTDNSLRRNILKISEESFQLIRYLLHSSGPGRRKTAARGFLLLQDLSDILDQLETVFEGFCGGDCSERNLQRGLHLIESMDEKVDEAVAELTGLADQLHSFLDVNEEFESERFESLVFQLETYNSDYLSRLAGTAGSVFGRLCCVEARENFRDFLTSLDQLENAGYENPSAESRRKVSFLLSFFDPATGKLDFYCRRVNNELRDTLRRIKNYLRVRHDRSLRIEEIRNRLREAFQASETDVSKWLGRLYSWVSIPIPATEGTPAEKALSPQPRREARKSSQDRSSQPLGKKKLTVEAGREMERLKMEKISRFFQEKVLQGLEENRISNTRLGTVEEVRLLMQGFKYARIKSGRRCSGLRNVIEPPQDRDERTTISGEGFEFACPDYFVRNKP